MGAVDPLERYHRVVKITRSTEAKSELKLTVPLVYQVEVSRRFPRGPTRPMGTIGFVFSSGIVLYEVLPRTLSPRSRLREHVEIVKYSDE